MVRCIICGNRATVVWDDGEAVAFTCEKCLFDNSFEWFPEPQSGLEGIENSRVYVAARSLVACAIAHHFTAGALWPDALPAWVAANGYGAEYIPTENGGRFVWRNYTSPEYPSEGKAVEGNHIALLDEGAKLITNDIGHDVKFALRLLLRLQTLYVIEPLLIRKEINANSNAPWREDCYYFKRYIARERVILEPLLPNQIIDVWELIDVTTS